jgi:hypothetical protein
MHATAIVVLILVATSSCECRRTKDPRPAAVTAGAQRKAGPAIKRTKPRTETRPTTPPSLPATGAAWSLAEKQNTAEAWDAAGEAYERERSNCTDDCLDAAYAVILARRNALRVNTIEPPAGDEPAPLPSRVRAMVEAADEYIKRTDPSDPDFVGLKFLAANALNRWRQPESTERLEELLREHRNDPSAEYAANMLLEALARTNRIAELKRWVDELLADGVFLSGKDALRQTLETLRAQIASGQ